MYIQSSSNPISIDRQNLSSEQKTPEESDNNQDSVIINDEVVELKEEGQDGDNLSFIEKMQQAVSD